MRRVQPESPRTVTTLFGRLNENEKIAPMLEKTVRWATTPPPERVVTFRVQLKHDNRASEQTTSPMTAKRKAKTTKKEDSKKKKKILSFEESVEVIPIPMRSEYSNRVRTRLWSSALEIRENALRNSIEFASEGWDWQNVLEDERMYVCRATSELIHPCHYERHSIHGFR